MPAAAPLLARLAMAVMFALLVAALLIGVARALGGVQLQAVQMLQLLAVAFNPEGAPGTEAAQVIFDDFLKLVK